MSASPGRLGAVLLALGCSGGPPATTSQDVMLPGDLGLAEAADTGGQGGADGTDWSDGESLDWEINAWPDASVEEDVFESVCQPACNGSPCQSNGCGGICELCDIGQACGYLGTCVPVGCEATSPQSWQVRHTGIRTPSAFAGATGLVRLEKTETVVWSPTWRRRVLSTTGDVISAGTFNLPGDGGWAMGHFRHEGDGQLAAATFYPQSNKQGQAGFIRLGDTGAFAAAVVVMPLGTLGASAAPLPEGDVVLAGMRVPVGSTPLSTGFVGRASSAGVVVWLAELGAPPLLPTDVDVSADSEIAVVTLNEVSSAVSVHFFDGSGGAVNDVTISGESLSYPLPGVCRLEDGWMVHLNESTGSRVVRLSSTGQVEFETTLPTVTMLPRGVVGFEGEWVVAGVYGAELQTNPYLAAIGDSGNLLWEREFGGAGREATEFLTRLPDGYLLSGAGPWLVGTGQSTFFIKTDTEGEAPLCD